ncbi:uncharacterized protein LOC105434747 [Cucumis sativus]|uniref:Uncharacterized protein n=1 Tax=Cucumis sativus TaxID=3659 RepID=A0A0A0LVL9_CUCSA|nr:uncharacterized protein LOC105434747 [Cucumis sativus]KGN64051.1 hypothetical protein Csa_014333 [Cucumis sativus]
MDLWVVAAATGAGYVAKYWKNQSKDGDNSLSQLSFGESNLVSPEYSNLFLDKFSLRKKPYEDVFGHGIMEETPSVSELGLIGSHQGSNGNELPTTNMTLKSWINENSKGHIGESSKSNNIGTLVCSSSRNRSTGNAKFSNGVLVKPLNLVEDCLLAHESSLNPCIAVELEENKLFKGSHLDANESLCGVSQLPFESLKISDIVSNKTGKEWERKSRSFSKMDNREHSASKGVADESFVLYLGVFIGVIFSFMSNKREVHNLKELLKQTEDLVQDLQEELEMKDSLKLKELSNDNCESYTYSNNAFSEKTADGSSTQHVMDYTINFNAEELYEHKAEESSESMSRIEAELEAELERLGLNVSIDCTARFHEEEEELDPEFEEDFAEGELRNEMIIEESCGWTKPNEEESNSTVHSGNYTVSPRELSLRLHDVIQSRLEARIKELENALQNNSKKLQQIDAQYRSSWLEVADDELEFISNTPI